MTPRLPDAPHVLITGTSGAIGGALARELAARRPRARLTLVDKVEAPSAELARELGNARVEVADLSDVDAIPALLERVGPVDGLINAAGFMDVRRFERFEWDAAWRLLAVDLVAPLRLFHEVSSGMLARGGGFVVNVTSMAGRVPIRGCAMYGAAKAGLSMASEIAHAELRPRGVHVVTVYPGPVASALERGARAQLRESAIARAIPMGKARALGRLVLEAVESGVPRVVYPSLYRVGFSAVGFASRVALAFGPEPIG
ncbi:MAG: SDR family NAD(P)-dependent oxidoreductase [Myxococcales bacterium]|nr:SDR family NAD(P)-dependent oxidoreductase [Myxococcales bacterium]